MPESKITCGHRSFSAHFTVMSGQLRSRLVMLTGQLFLIVNNLPTFIIRLLLINRVPYRRLCCNTRGGTIRGLSNNAVYQIVIIMTIITRDLRVTYRFCSASYHEAN